MSFAVATHNFKACNESKGLLLQFVLSEFIKTYREILALHQSLEEGKQTSFNIAKLTGSCKKSMGLFSWNQEDGVLWRLKNYCKCLASLEKTNNTLISKMQLSVNQAYINSLHCLDLIQYQEYHAEDLQKAIRKIIDQMSRFSKALASLLQQFRDNEHLIFFLLRHRIELDQIYGRQFLFKLINRMYPKGIEEASSFLLNQYKKRGFNHCIPIIKKQIAELKK